MPASWMNGWLAPAQETKGLPMNTPDSNATGAPSRRPEHAHVGTRSRQGLPRELIEAAMRVMNYRTRALRDADPRTTSR